jgi:hypothetical protein
MTTGWHRRVREDAGRLRRQHRAAFLVFRAPILDLDPIFSLMQQARGLSCYNRSRGLDSTAYREGPLSAAKVNPLDP